MNKKILSVVVIVSMLLNITMPHIAVFAEEVDNTAENKIIEQLKDDLGEEKASQIISVSEEEYEFYSTTNIHTINNEDDKNLVSGESLLADATTNFDEESNVTSIKKDIVEKEIDFEEEYQNDRSLEEEPEEDEALEEEQKEDESIVDDESSAIETLTDVEDEKEQSNDKELSDGDNQSNDDNQSDDKKQIGDIQQSDYEASDIEDGSAIESDDNANSADTEKKETIEKSIIEEANNIEQTVNEEPDNAVQTVDAKQPDYIEQVNNETTSNADISATENNENENLIIDSESQTTSKVAKNIVATSSDIFVEEEIVATNSETIDETIIEDKNMLATNSEVIDNELLDASNLNSLLATTSEVTENLFGAGITHYIDSSWKESMRSLNYRFYIIRKLSFVNDGNEPTYIYEHWHIDNQGLDAYIVNNNGEIKIIISIPQGDTLKLRNDGSYLFAASDGNQQLDLCEMREIENLDLLDTSECTNMSHMFEACGRLTNLDLSNFNTENVTNMSHMFEACNKLTNLNLSNFNTENVTNMSSMFMNCNRLESITFGGDFITNNLEAPAGDRRGGAYEMFKYCNSLTSLDLSNFNIQEYMEPAGMLSYCEELRSIIINESVSNYIGVMLDSGRWKNTSTGVIYDFTDIPSNVAAEYERTGNLILEKIYWYLGSDGTLHLSGDSNLTGYNSDDWINENRLSLGNVDWDSNDVIRVVVDSTISPTNMNSWFSEYKNMIEIDFGNIDTSECINMFSMFEYCSSLTNITFGNNFDTSNVINMSYMFYYCSSLTNLNLSGFNTNNVTNMSFMFGDCNSLTSLDLSSFNTNNVTNMSFMFSGCSGLTSLDVSSFNTNNVTDMSFMFDNCSSLTNLDLSCFNTSNVTNMRYMFACGMNNGYYVYYEYQSKLANITGLENFNTSNVTDMSSMFGNCRSLTSLDLSSFNTSNVTNMSSMFYFCRALTSLDVNSFNTSNVTNMSSMFCYCMNIPSLDLSNFDTSNATDMSSIFLYCRNLSNLNMSGWDFSNVISRYNMFYMCKSLRINLSNAKMPQDCSHFFNDYYVSYDYNNNIPTFRVIDLSNVDTSNVTNMSYMFWNCGGLTSLDLSDFDTSNVTDMTFIFSDCSRLTSLNVSSFNTSNVTSMGGMFYGCSRLTSLDLSGFDTSNVTNMGGMFRNCSGLTSLDLSSFDTRNVTNMSFSSSSFYYYGLFAGCTKLRTLNLSGWDFSNIANLESSTFMFINCSSLEEINLSNAKMPQDCTGFFYCFDFNHFSTPILREINLSNVDTSNVTNMCDMFGSCSSLTSLNLSSFNTSNVTDMSSMFRNCSSLTNLDVGSFDTSNVTDMTSMFSGCSCLTSLDLSGFDTRNVTDIGSMFRNCSRLTSLDLSSFDTRNVTNMISSSYYSSVYFYYGLFEGCTELRTLNLSGWDFSNIAYSSSNGSNKRYHMFYECTSLEEINLSNAKMPQDSRYFFGGDIDLSYRPIFKTINLSNTDTNNVTDMSYMFYNCSDLTSLDLSDFDTSNVTNMRYMFSGCSDLTSLDLSNFNTSNVTSSNMYSLSSCAYLSYLKISNITSGSINNLGLRGNWKDLETNIIYNYDSSTGKTTIPDGGGEYQRVNYYTITYHVNGGTEIPVAFYNAGSTAYFSTPQRTGWTFEGWYRNPALTDKYTLNFISSIDSDYVCYAKWIINTYTVAFNVDGGSAIAPQSKNYGELIDIPANPTKPGYVFAGWYKEISKINIFDFSVPVTSNTTIFAKWRDPESIYYDVSFNLQGHGANIATQSVIESGNVTRPTDPTADGYVFAGWFKEPECQNEWNFNTNVVVGTTILYAKWNQLFTVAFDIRKYEAAQLTFLRHQLLHKILKVALRQPCQQIQLHQDINLMVGIKRILIKMYLTLILR